MKSYKVFLFLVAVFILLAGLCIVFPREGITIGKVTLRFPSIHQVLVREPEVDIDELLRQEEVNRQLLGFRDSVEYYRQRFQSEANAFQTPNGDPTYFDTLFTLLAKALEEQRTRRILHYGDSQIEMDRMTIQLREYMQRTFGGGGPGLLPIKPSAGSRSVNYYASGNLSHQSSFIIDDATQTAHGNYGPMAHCWHLAGSATSGVTASASAKTPQSFKHFTHITLLFNNRPGPLSATLKAPAANYSDQQSSSTSGVQAFHWQLDTAVAAINLQLQGDADIYGIMVDNGPGVAVDNIALRGCSGQQFTMIDAAQLSESYALMDVALIILQFGGNSVPYLRPGSSLHTYCESLSRQIARLREACPGVTLLFIGPSDMSTTVDGQIQSYPSMPIIVDSLRNMALRNNVAYWSIYDAMGGFNSMRTWVDNGLANTDYIHFSTKGVDIMGQQLADAFACMYEFYKLRQRITTSQFDSIWNNKYQFDSIQMAHDSINRQITEEKKNRKET